MCVLRLILDNCSSVFKRLAVQCRIKLSLCCYGVTLPHDLIWKPHGIQNDAKSFSYICQYHSHFQNLFFSSSHHSEQ